MFWTEHLQFCKRISPQDGVIPDRASIFHLRRTFSINLCKSGDRWCALARQFSTLPAMHTTGESTHTTLTPIYIIMQILHPYLATYSNSKIMLLQPCRYDILYLAYTLHTYIYGHLGFYGCDNETSWGHICLLMYIINVYKSFYITG